MASGQAVPSSHKGEVPLFLCLAKSYSYLDWTRSSFLLLLPLQAGVQLHSHLSAMQRAPLISSYFPSCADGWTESWSSAAACVCSEAGPADAQPDLAGFSAWQCCKCGAASCHHILFSAGL